MTGARRKVLVTGARGQLAGAITDTFAQGEDVCACSRADLDITNPEAVMTVIGRERPDLIVNCASYNLVDQAEDEPREALDVNAFAVRLLARAATSVNATLVHYSTDFVFDGTASRPYTEEDAPNPQSVYAQSKLLGEWFAREAPRSFVIRVESLFGGAVAKSSIDRIVSAIAEGRDANVFADRTVTPSYVVDVATATKALVERGEPGLYHCVGTGSATWYEVAREIARVMGKTEEARLVPISVADVVLRAKRPQYSALANDKLARIVPLPTWQDALRRHLA